MENKEKKYRTFTVIVHPKYFDVESIKEGTFKFTEDELVGVSHGTLVEHFFDVVSMNYKAKKSAVLPWFENEK
jgi:hypothetical protein